MVAVERDVPPCLIVEGNCAEFLVYTFNVSILRYISGRIFPEVSVFGVTDTRQPRWLDERGRRVGPLALWV